MRVGPAVTFPAPECFLGNSLNTMKTSATIIAAALVAFSFAFINLPAAASLGFALGLGSLIVGDYARQARSYRFAVASSGVNRQVERLGLAI